MKRCLFAFYLCLLVDGLEWVSYQHRRHVAPAVSLRYWLRKASWSSRRTPCVCCPVVVYFSLLDGVFSFGLRKTRALSQHLCLMTTRGSKFQARAQNGCDPPGCTDAQVLYISVLRCGTCSLRTPIIA